MYVGVRAFDRATLRRLRIERHLTQTRLAEQLGIHPRTLARWEAGRGAPDARMVALIARELRVARRELVSAPQVPTLRDLRTTAALTQRQLAAQLGIDQATYSRHERGHLSLDPGRVRDLAAALGVTQRTVREAFGQTSPKA